MYYIIIDVYNDEVRVTQEELTEEDLEGVNQGDLRIFKSTSSIEEVVPE